MGAVTGAHDCLKTVTIATTKPPSAPMSSRPIAADGSAERPRLQVQLAVATTQMSRRPVLLTVPSTVIPRSPVSERAFSNVLSLRTGLPVRKLRAIGDASFFDDLQELLSYRIPAMETSAAVQREFFDLRVEAFCGGCSQARPNQRTTSVSRSRDSNGTSIQPANPSRHLVTPGRMSARSADHDQGRMGERPLRRSRICSPVVSGRELISICPLFAMLPAAAVEVAKMSVRLEVFPEFVATNREKNEFPMGTRPS